MKIRIYQVDAFTDTLFTGNPAAICPLEAWLPDHLLQNIAMENNLAETGFYVPAGEKYELRWFTPTVEVDLCGHATLAAAHVLFHHENHSGNSIHFHSPRSGALTVTKTGNLLTLDFPADMPKEIELTDALDGCFNQKPVKAFKGIADYLLIFPSESDIQNLQPELLQIAGLDARGVIATAKGEQTDFVSRWFGPQVGVNEDPVTGSAHTTLTPYWAQVLGKTELTARQLSARGGNLSCKHLGTRVAISGQARTYLTGQIQIA